MVYLGYKSFFMKRLLLLLVLTSSVSAYAQKWAKQYDFVDQCICGLSIAGKNNKIGYVNEAGTVIIPLLYDEGLTFSEGYTAVRIGTVWTYFDSTGKKMSDEQFNDAQSFHNGMAAVMKNKRYGYIDTKGSTVINYQFSNARAFAEGVAPVENEKGLWGYINTKGEYVIMPEYTFADSFDNHEARIIKGNETYYIDKDNKKLHE